MAASFCLVKDPLLSFQKSDLFQKRSSSPFLFSWLPTNHGWMHACPYCWLWQSLMRPFYCYSSTHHPTNPASRQLNSEIGLYGPNELLSWDSKRPLRRHIWKLESLIPWCASWNMSMHVFINITDDTITGQDALLACPSTRMYIAYGAKSIKPTSRCILLQNVSHEGTKDSSL